MFKFEMIYKILVSYINRHGFLNYINYYLKHVQRDTRMQEMLPIYSNVLDCRIAYASDDIFLMKISRHVTFNKYSTMTLL